MFSGYHKNQSFKFYVMKFISFVLCGFLLCFMFLKSFPILKSDMVCISSCFHFSHCLSPSRNNFGGWKVLYFKHVG